MTGYDVNRGVLFKNSRKNTDKHPDYTGSFTMPNGTEHWLSAWIRRDKYGNAYMSVALGNEKVPREQPAQSGWNAPATPEPAGDIDDDIPF